MFDLNFHINIIKKHLNLDKKLLWLKILVLLLSTQNFQNIKQ